MTELDENNIICPRMGEDEDRIPFRSDRLFSIGIDWYFSTREGTDHGPYRSKEGAQDAVANYIRDKPF